MRPILLLLFPVLLALSACGTDTWFGKAGDPILPGKRVPVLISDNEVKPDDLIAEAPVLYPPAAANKLWPMAGGFPDHSMQHLALNNGNLAEAWNVSIGSGSSSSGFLLSAPVSYGGRVFTIDTAAEVRAFDLQTGNQIWSADLRPKGEDSKTLASGGLATDGNTLFAATGLAELTGLSASAGKILWRQPVSSPIRSAPTLAEGKVFIVPVDNKLMALNAKDGILAWMYEGLNESAALLGGSSPAASNGIVVAPFSSGDLIAFDTNKGKQIWVENLSRVRRGDLLATITSVRALPVIDQGRVYAIGHGERAMAIDLPTGDRIWDLPIGGVQTPWIAGKYLFMIDNKSNLLCIEADRGLIKWVRNLNENAEKPKRFAGPLLAGNRLWVVGTDEKLTSFNPQDGTVTGSYDLPGPASIAPIVVDNNLLVLTDNGKLVAFR